MYELRKTSKGYGVWNKEKGIWKSYDTTKKKAEAQLKLLHYLDFAASRSSMSKK